MAETERERGRGFLRAYLPVLVCLAVLGMAVGVSYALTVLTVRLAGVGVLEFTDEARVEDIIVFDESTVVAVIAPTENTVAGKEYTVRLYLDGALSGETAISWTEDELCAGARKVVVFTGLDLSGVCHIQVEVLG